MAEQIIEEQYLSMAATALAYAATHEPFPAGVIQVVRGPSDDQPTFQAVYDALSGLPEDHPLIKGHGRDTLEKGYERRDEYRVDTSEAVGPVCLKLQPMI